MKKTLLLLVVSVMFVSLASQGAFAQPFSLESVIEPLKGLDIAGTYERYPYVIDSIFYLIFFIGIAQLTLSKRFEGPGGKAVIISFGIALSVSMAVWSHSVGFNIGNIGPLVGILFAVAFAILVWRMLFQGKGNGWEALRIGFIAVFIMVHMFFPEAIGALRAMDNGEQVYNGLQLAAAIFFIFMLVHFLSGRRSQSRDWDWSSPGAGRPREGPGLLRKAAGGLGKVIASPVTIPLWGYRRWKERGRGGPGPPGAASRPPPISPHPARSRAGSPTPRGADPTTTTIPSPEEVREEERTAVETARAADGTMHRDVEIEGLGEDVKKENAELAKLTIQEFNLEKTAMEILQQMQTAIQSIPDGQNLVEIDEFDNLFDACRKVIEKIEVIKQEVNGRKNKVSETHMSLMTELNGLDYILGWHRDKINEVMDILNTLCNQLSEKVNHISRLIGAAIAGMRRYLSSSLAEEPHYKEELIAIIAQALDNLGEAKKEESGLYDIEREIDDTTKELGRLIEIERKRVKKIIEIEERKEKILKEEEKSVEALEGWMGEFVAECRGILEYNIIRDEDNFKKEIETLADMICKSKDYKNIRDTTKTMIEIIRAEAPHQIRKRLEGLGEGILEIIDRIEEEEKAVREAKAAEDQGPEFGLGDLDLPPPSEYE